RAPAPPDTPRALLPARRSPRQAAATPPAALPPPGHPPPPAWSGSRSGQRSHLAQQLQRALEVVKVAQVDVRRLNLAERCERLIRRDTFHQRVLVRLGDEVLLRLFAQQPGDELLGNLAALIRLART